ncbi:Transcriptional regulator, MarR family [Anaerovibrio sp. JC8]|uniref:MarR family transcriptional regulator n=1 Tax=Anaerovibrio sp. JC8 TaxID=1240085 RepID=UPI000A09FB88|nr:MarR family transcriptional regulator [Anaerovibrio sp. JC8]ORT98880.1 Transcriptional regulator, MarR family [Anaerovibrio sp. JC8]
MDYHNTSINFGIIRRRVQSLVVEASMDLGLTYAEFSLLLVLYDKEGCSQDDMTNFLHVDKAAVTRVIKILEKKELLYRKQDEVDRRMKRLFLTEKGKELESTIRDIVKKIMDYVAEGFSEADAAFMVKGLDVLAARLGAADYESVFGKKGSGAK